MRSLYLIPVLFLAAACATPINPTGGEPDKEPLKVLRTDPPTGTLQFRGDRVTFFFDDFPDRAGLAQAVRVLPQGIRFETVPGRKSVTVRFLSPLPDSTTVQVVLSTSAADFRRNPLESPETVAFSTGDRIDGGRLAGALRFVTPVRDTRTWVILLHRPADSLTSRPRYFTQPDTAGQFQLSYVREAEYRISALLDRNGNYRLDPGERIFPTISELIKVDTALTEGLDLYTVMPADTAMAELAAAGVLTFNRVRLRFSRAPAVVLPAVIPVFSDGRVADSLVLLHADRVSPQVIFGMTANPLDPAKNYEIRPRPGLWRGLAQFTGSAQKDTALFLPAALPNGKFMRQTEPLRMLYSKLIPEKGQEGNPADSLLLLANGSPVRNAMIASRYNEIRVLPGSEGWQPDVNYEVKMYVPATRTYLSHRPLIHFDRDSGQLEARVDSTAAVRFFVERKDGLVRQEGLLKPGDLLDLPSGSYFVCFFKDLDGNGVWTPGQVVPFKPGEPVFSARNIQISRGMTTELRADLAQ